MAQLITRATIADRPQLAHTDETSVRPKCRLSGVDRTSSRHDQIDADLSQFASDTEALRPEVMATDRFKRAAAKAGAATTTAALATNN